MRLSDFPEEKAFEIAAEAMPLVMRLKFNPKTVKWLKEQRGNDKEREPDLLDGTPYAYYGEMLKNDKQAAVELFALLNGKTPEKYRSGLNAATVLSDMYTAFIEDAELMSLFGLRLRKETSTSGAASENTEE